MCTHLVNLPSCNMCTHMILCVHISNKGGDLKQATNEHRHTSDDLQRNTYILDVLTASTLNRTKGNSTMSHNEIISKIEALREWEALANVQAVHKADQKPPFQYQRIKRGRYPHRPKLV